MDKKLLDLGLAYKAKKIILGETIYDNLSKIKLIIIAKDISLGNKKRILKKCESYKIDYIDTYDSKDLSQAIGKNNVKLIGIIDDGFKKMILN